MEELASLAGTVAEAVTSSNLVGRASPGMVIGLSSAESVQVVALGTSSFHHGRMESDAVFQVASLTKSFTATLVVNLADSGHLRLDDPVERVIGELPGLRDPRATPVTIRHLLSHTAGWDGDWFNSRDVSSGGKGSDLSTLPRALADVPFLCPTGTMSYSNLAYWLLGTCVEAVTGEAFEEAMRTRVLEPLRLANAEFATREAPPRAAPGVNAAGDLVAWARPSVSLPSGGLAADVEDLLRWGRFHLEGGPVLSDDARQSMQHAHAHVSAIDEERVGLGWFTSRRGGVRIVEHGGKNQGYCSNLTLLPDTGIVAVLLTNGVQGDRLTTVAQDGLLRAVGASAETAQEEASYGGEADGTYRSGLGDEYRLTRGEHGRLQFGPVTDRGTEALPFRGVAGDAAVCASPSLARLHIDFVRDPSGEVRWLRFGRRLYVRS